ncbi:MAG: DMT family transporter [Candidatus Thermoplasmatota archaeon]|jgi:drug/metabolite transporter (DMT)-like permease|nr:DMT family transporter [Candidatus Thermoplasmatota archaeon]
MEKKLFYMLMLLLVTFFWGVTFPIIKTALQYISADAFLAFRFLVATALMGILVRKGGDFWKRRNIVTGFTAGFLLFLGYYFQTVGLDYTSAAASGIITGIYVVILPLISFMFLHNRVSRMDVYASVIAFAGLIIMSVGSSAGFGSRLGDLLTLICGVAYAVQIAYVSRYSGSLNSYTFTFYQLLAVTIFSFAAIPISPGGIGTFNGYVVFALVFTAIFGSIFGYYVSTIALIYVDPAAAGVIYVGEPVFAALSSVIIAHEALGISVIIGGTVMVTAMLMTSLDKYLKMKRMPAAQS